MLHMDVDQDASVRLGVEAVLEREGQIDVVVNCAGYGLSGAVEDTPLDAAKAQFETNFFGTMRVCQAVLPAMREQRSGLIVNISSIAGLIGWPFCSIYTATKFAIEGFTEALSIEVKPFGIRVVMVEPGDFHTGFTSSRYCVEPSSAYAQNFECALDVIEHDELNGANPETLARVVERIVNSRSPRLRYITGPLYERGAVILKMLLPSRLFEWALGKYYKLEGM
jgi:NAD(P)-dependent dehydrogenase (short-subunit alcohol dehydrogenase family)